MAEDKRERDKSKYYFFILAILFVVTAGAVSIIGGREQGFSDMKIGKTLIGSVMITVLFTTVLEYICKKNVELPGEKSRGKKENCYKRYACLIGFVVILSYGIILGDLYREWYSFWMLGGLILAVSLNVYMGIALEFFTFFLSCFFRGSELEYFVIYFILGAGLCLLSSFLRQVSTLGYVMIIGLTGNGVALALEKDFSLDKVLSLGSLYSEFSIFWVILIAAGLSWLYRGYFVSGNFGFIRTGIESFFSEEESDWKEGMLIRIGDLEIFSNKENKTKDFLDKLADSAYPLLKQLKEAKPKVYSHSKQVAVLAEGAAEYIGIDKQMVYIGGMYHEIGKLHSKDYVQEGIALAEEYGFPEELINLIGEHNVKYKIPTTKESAVLMLADSVIFLLEHVEKNGVKNKSVKDMIESIFRIRYEKGELDESGLTIGEFKMLRQYCVGYGLNISGKEEGE